MARTKQTARRPNEKYSPKKAPFHHAHLSDDELFKAPYELLTNDVILRLARKYASIDIFNRFNAVQPGIFKKPREITDRLQSAVRTAARTSGRSTDAIRKEINMARNSGDIALEGPAEVVVAPSAEGRKVAVTPKVRSSSALAPNLGTHFTFLFVGDQHEPSTIHTALFPVQTRTILDTRAQQNRVRGEPIYLINEMPETFEVYRQFLYFGIIYSNTPQTDQDPVDDGRDEAYDDSEWIRFAHLYTMGLDLDDEKFRNAVVDSLVEKVSETNRYPTGIATGVYSRTTKGDKLRSLIVDLHVWKGQGTGVREPHDDASGPFEFVQNVLHTLAEARGDPYDPDVQMPWDVNLYQYHLHTVTAPCERQTVSATAAIESEHMPSTALVPPRGRRVIPARKGAAHKCDACNLTFTTSNGLSGHKGSGSHKEKAKAWAGQAA